MADVQSTATLTLNVVGEDKVKSLASSLNEIKSSAGEASTSVGQSFSNIEQSAKGAETRIKKLGEMTATAQRPSEEAWQAQLAREAEDTRAWQERLQKKGMAKAPEALAAKEAPPGVPEAPAAAEGLAGLGGVAQTAGAAIAALGVTAAAAGIAIKGFQFASEAAAKSSRDILQTTASAQRAGIDFEQAQRERMAGEGLFGAAGLNRVEQRLERSVREGGKGMAKDLQAIGVSPAEARPTPVSLAQRAVARREELTRAIQEAPTEEARAAAQATMNEFTSALIRRAGPDMSRVAAEESSASLAARIEGARRTAEAFRRDVEPQQLADQARANERALAESRAIRDQYGKTFGEAVAPGVTSLQEQINKMMTEGAPFAAAAGDAASTIAGSIAKGLESPTLTAAFGPWAGAVKSVGEAITTGAKGLLGVTPAAAAEAPRPPPEEMPRLQPPAPEEMPKLEVQPPEELPKIQVDPAGLEQVAGMGEGLGASISSSLAGIDMSGVGANIGASIQSSMAGIDLSAAGASIGASIQASLAGIDLSAAGAGVGEAIGSAASASISAAGSAGGEAFSSIVQGGISAAGSSGGAAFSAAASSGITAAGSAGGAAFNAAVNGSAIGSAIGSAAAAVISAARVQVNVSVPAGASGGGGTTGGATTGKDSAT